MKKTIWSLTLIALSLGAQAQKKLTVEDAVMKGRSTLAPENLSGLSWIPGSEKYYYFANRLGQNCLVMGNLTTSVTDTLSLGHLNEALSVFNGTINRGMPIEAFKRFPAIQHWADDHRIRFVSGKYVFVYDITQKFLNIEHELEEGASNLEFHTESGNLAYTLGKGLRVKPLREISREIAADSRPGIVLGQSVHRNEFGIQKGLFWSEAGNRLAFYRMDESMVTEYPMYDLEKMPAGADFIRYPFAGKKSHEVTVGIYDVKKNTTIYLKTGQPAEQYLTNISWSPDEKYIYIAVVNREQNFMALRRFNALTGEQEGTLFTESNEKYVEPEHPMLWISDKEFIWQSERSGFNHLYLYNAKGQMIKALTSGNWMVTDLIDYNKKNGNIVFSSTQQGPLNNTISVVSIASGKITELTPESGVHAASVSSNGKYVLNSWTSPQTPRIQRILDIKGKGVKTLLTAKNPLADYTLGETSVFTIKSTDGTTDLYCRMIKPANFDPAKKYPVVVYLYGGPHLQLIRNNWLAGSDLWMQYMAQEGYVVFSLDNRGSANRGFEFESTIHRQVGTLEIEDQLAGVNYLKQQSFVDAGRMAVFGWSFGGFMATNMMTRAAGPFKVGIAGGPVIDWSMYEIMYTERYMDSPEENPEGYAKNALFQYIDKLDGHLLMIHGTSDDVVLWQHSLLYVKKCVEKGKQIDYFVYPEHAHNVIGKDRVHLMEKISQYLFLHLGK